MAPGESSSTRRSLLQRTLLGAGLLLTFTTALVGGALLHIGTARARRSTAALLTDVLSQVFSGRVVINHIDHIDLFGFEGASATVFDPQGEQVLAVTGLRGHSSLLALARTLLAGGSEMEIVIPGARVEHVEVNILPDEEGIPSIARAFTPRKSGKGGSGPAPQVRVWLPRVEMGTAHAHGSIAGLRDLDVDLANIAGSVLAGTERSLIQVKRYSLRAHGPFTAVAAQGTAATLIQVPSATGKSVSLWSTFDGYLGDVQVSARLGVDGSELDLLADIPKARPEAVRAIYPAWPLLQDAALHAEAQGIPSNLAVKGDANLGDGRATFTGALQLTGGLHTNLVVDAHTIDLRSFIASAPPTSLVASGTLALAATGDGARGSIEANTQPFNIEGVDVGPASITAKIEGPHVSGRAIVHDPALLSQIDFDVTPGASGDPLVLGLDWTARTPDLARVAWLRPVGQGQASFHAKGQIVGGVLDARADATVSRFSRSGVSLDRARLSGSVHGPFDRLVIASSLHGEGFQAGPLSFPAVDATAKGPLSRLSVATTTSGDRVHQLTAHAFVVRNEQGARLDQVELTVQQGEVALTGKAQRIEVVGDRVDLAGIVVEGAGQPIAGSVSISPSRFSVRGSATDVDLQKLFAVLLPGYRVEGRIAFDIDAELAGRSETARARFELKEGKVAGFKGLTARAEANIADHRFSGGADISVGELGSARVTSVDADLAGPMLQSTSWIKATGQLQVEATVDLDRVKNDVPLIIGPLLDVGGTLRARALLSRETIAEHQKHEPHASESPSPNIDLLLWTDKLKVAFGRRNGLLDLHPVPLLSSDESDLQVGLHIEGETEHAQLTAHLVDHQGMFAALTAIADIPLRSLWLDRSRLGARLAELPMTARLTLPRRSVGSYPSFARSDLALGEVEAAGVMTGSVRSPRLALSVRGYAVQAASAAIALPVDLDLEASYDGLKGAARLQASRPEGVVLDARTEVRAPLASLLGEEQDGPRWEADGAARLIDFPLASVPAFAENEVSGLASGTFSFAGLNRDPAITAQIDLKNVQLEKAVFPSGRVILRVAQGQALASAKLDQVDGGASASASAHVQWTSPLWPELDTQQPLDLFMEAREFRAAALYPLLFRGVFTYFDGRLNGTLHLHEEVEQGKVAQSVDGSFDLRDGVFQVPEIGQEFRNARAQLIIAKGGEVQVNDVSANGVAGRLTAAGTMALRGFSFSNAEGTLRIAEKEAVPLTLEGVSLGSAWGTVLLHAKMTEEHKVKLDLDVPVFHTDLPASSSRAVQGLGDHPDVKVGFRTAVGELSPVLLGPPQAKRADDALAWHLTFYLGQDVRLRRGSTMEIVMSGEPVVDLTDEAHVSGFVNFMAGSIEVFGKRFEIEHGNAKFEGDEPSNPIVSVTARWDAPDGTRVFADFVGPLRTGAVSLRSEPARSQSEILAILVFGAGDTGSSDPGPSQLQQQGNGVATGGWVLAGGALTSNVNQVLSSVTPLDITTRITSDSQTPTPEVAIQVSRQVTAEASYRTGALNPAQRQDRLQVTLDWRFRRNWSIATTVGDQGTSILDLIWKYRY